jgi:hypothetical protein
MDDRYGRDVLSQPRRAKPRPVEVAADRDLVVEDAATGFCGAVVGLEKSYAGDLVRLENRHGRTRVFLMNPGAFLIDGRTVTLVRPRTRGPQKPATTASGSRAAPRTRAPTSRASRIFV